MFVDGGEGGYRIYVFSPSQQASAAPFCLDALEPKTSRPDTPGKRDRLGQVGALAGIPCQGGVLPGDLDDGSYVQERQRRAQCC